MGNTIYLSCLNKADISAVGLFRDGRCISKSVKRIFESTRSNNQYSNLIYSYYRGARMVRSYIEENNDVDELVIECNNSSFIKWLERGYSKPDYEEEFYELMELIQDIPVRYTVIYSKTLKAKPYAKEGCLDRQKLGSISDMFA